MKLLIADDDKNLRTVLANELSGEGYDISLAKSGSVALELLKKEHLDIVLLDLNMPDLSGMEVLKIIMADDIPVEVIILTAYATVPTAVEAMKLGAYDYLTKPFKLEELSTIINKAFERKQLHHENISLKTQLQRQQPSYTMVTQNPAMQKIMEDVKKMALSEFPVLIYGESGSGKEVVARAVHDASEKAEGPFIPINCGAIPENMVESELFGYEKGAFTGASSAKLGLIEVANNGTLFLDEIGELPLQLQVKLLRVIETQHFMRLGGVREIKVNLKFVSATNKDLKDQVKQGNFRKDLYYRISTFSIHIPPLRERKEDILLLIEHFIKSNHIFKNKRLDKDAVRLLSEYTWPGNIRELQNVIHRTFFLSTNQVIGADELPPDIVSAKHVRTSRIEDVEREHILNVLKEAGGNRGKAAEILGIDTKTLYRKLKGYGYETADK